MNILFFIFICGLLWGNVITINSYIGLVKEKNRCSINQVLLKIWQNLQEKTSLGVSFLINFFKKRLRHKCFFVNFVKFFRTSFFIEHLWCFWRQKVCFQIRCIVVFTYLSSNILLRRIAFDFMVKIFKESHTKTEASKSKVIVSADVIISYRVITLFFYKQSDFSVKPLVAKGNP